MVCPRKSKRAKVRDHKLASLDGSGPAEEDHGATVNLGLSISRVGTSRRGSVSMAKNASSSTLSDQGGRPSTREKLMMPIPMEACLRLVIRLVELGLYWMLPNGVIWLFSHRWAPK